MRYFSPLFILIFFSYFVFEILADSKFISCVYNAKNIISGRKICSQRLYLGHAAYSWVFSVAFAAEPKVDLIPVFWLEI